MFCEEKVFHISQQYPSKIAVEEFVCEKIAGDICGVQIYPQIARDICSVQIYPQIARDICGVHIYPQIARDICGVQIFPQISFSKTCIRNIGSQRRRTEEGRNNQCAPLGRRSLGEVLQYAVGDVSSRACN